MILTLTLMFLAAPVASGSSQLEGDAAYEYIFHVAEHIEAVRAEREAELQWLFLNASEERQQLASEVLITGRGAGLPALQPVGFDVLQAARTALMDGGRETSALQQLASSLDLRVTPGLFEARTSGLGEAMTVSVSQLWRAPGRDANMSLWWISSTGERTRARTEPITQLSAEAGFEMYIRPPLSAPGVWQLVPELEAGDERAFGISAPVECIADLEPLREALPTDNPLSAKAASRRIAQDLFLLLRCGVRNPGLASLAEQFTVQAEASSNSLRLVESDTVADAIVLELSPASASGAARAVLVASSALRPAYHATAEALGAAWHALAKDPELRVFSASLPSTEHGAEAWLKLCAELKQSESIDDLVIVATGELALLMPRALQLAETKAVDGLVLVDSPATSKPPREVPCAMLLVDGGASRAGEEHGELEGQPWTRLEREAADLFLALRVPALIAEWMARE